MSFYYEKENLESKLKDLFIRSMSGDKVAYDNFLHFSSAIVLKYLYYLGHRSTGNESLEDLQQEVMMSIHQKKQSYQIDRPILPWIYAITKYRYIDYYRAQKRLPKTVEFFDDIPAHEKDGGLNFDDVVTFLSPRQKEMLQLVKIEGVSYVSAAEELGMSVPSLKVGIHRIMKSLQQRMRK